LAQTLLLLLLLLLQHRSFNDDVVGSTSVCPAVM